MGKKTKKRFLWSKEIFISLVLLVLLIGLGVILKRYKVINSKHQEISTSVTNNDNIACTGRYSEQITSFGKSDLQKFLQVDLEVNVDKPSWYSFTTALSTTDGKLIAVGDLSTENRAAPVDSIELKRGKHIIPIYFRGQSIVSSKRNGPYLVRVFIWGLSKRYPEVDSKIEFKTRKYSWYDFIVI